MAKSNNPATKESGEILKLVIDVINGIVASTEDGKWSFTDSLNFWSAATDAPAAVKDINLAGAELKVSENRKSLKEDFKTEFNLPNKESEAVVERIIDWVAEGVDIVDLLTKKKA